MEQLMTTKAGLHVPASAITRKRRVVLADTFKQMKRCFTNLRAEGLATLLMCADCKQVIELRLDDRLVENVDGQAVGGGRPVLRCRCTDRAVR